jgi:serine palmitoyltransferase
MTPPVLAQLVASMASIMGIADSHPQSRTSGSLDSSVTLSTSDLLKEQEHSGLAPRTLLPIWMDLPAALCDGSEGRSRLRRLAFNSRYLHSGLNKLGFITYGHPSSPIVPLLIFNLGKLPFFHRMMKDRATPIIVVVVAYPATSLVSGRARFCLSAAHTKEDVDLVLKACDEIGDILDLKHGQGERWPIEDIMRRSVELVNQ